MLVGAGGAGRALAFGAKSRGARVVIFNRKFGNYLQLFSLSYGVFALFLIWINFLEERAKALAQAVSGEAFPIESLDTFCPMNGMILANASAIGMEPNIDATPVPKVFFGCMGLFCRFVSCFSMSTERIITNQYFLDFRRH